jgi:phosphatidylserine decarboxylase
MTIHKEGRTIIPLFFIILLGLALLVYWLVPVGHFLRIPLFAAAGLLLLWVVLFFRSPARTIVRDESLLLSPADGRVVVVEHTYEGEYLQKDMLKISIFMSPFNVHLNRYPLGGRICYYRHHPGKYLVAWHPKSSVLNERSSIGLETSGGHGILIKQVAGFLARRIVTYCREGDQVSQGGEMGFIKFGSRVDLYLPSGSKPLVAIGDRVKGGLSHLASIG